MDNRLERKRKILNSVIGLAVLLLFVFSRILQSYLYGKCFASWPIYVLFSVLYVLFPRFYITKENGDNHRLSWGINRTHLYVRISASCVWLIVCLLCLNYCKPTYTLSQASTKIYSVGYSDVHYTGVSSRDGESKNLLVSWMPVFEAMLPDGTVHYISFSLITGNIIPQSQLESVIK